jgi:putative transport protein
VNWIKELPPEWIKELPHTQPVAWAVIVLMIVAVTGLVLAHIKIRGIGIGVVGVLFTGILAGHLGLHIETEILEFVREFGLILFVFTIGLQLGPGFFASFRKQGLKLNFMAIAIVLLGALLAVAAAHLAGVDLAAALGLFSGATTNTPSLGATQQMVKTLHGAATDKAAIASIAYAVSYPGGVVGIIGSLVLLRGVFRIDAEKEADAFRHEQKGDVEPLERMNLVVENPNLENLKIADVPGRDAGVVVSRIRRAGAAHVEIATDETVLHQRDVILAVGTGKALEKFRVVIGSESALDLTQLPGRVVAERMVVTRKEVLGETIESLQLGALYGATITRVTRGDLEITAAPELRLQFGDRLTVVADETGVTKVAAVVGNRFGALSETNFLPIFAGILLGVFVGMIPIAIPGMPVPVKLGIAGGPLILAILLSRIGRIGPLVWYMPLNANLAFRELGITLFLACVGLKAGDKFFATAFTADGLRWLVCGLVITMLPLCIVGVAARLMFKLNFTVISGLLSGSMTDPPALAFANAVCKSDAPSVAYATVYPLTMLLRVLTVQILAVVFWGGASAPAP